MDAYTAKTKQWLNARFRQTTSDGVFYAHQNIYGFKSRYVEEGVIMRYAIFYNVLNTLRLIRYESLLDVGGAEGYMSAAIREIFKVKVRSCDLSDEACRRAKEIFGVDADPVDGVSLPYPDSSFDVVLSSESLEHIPEYETVLNELLRVARKAVLITVPHDGPEAVADNIRRQVPHGHIHDFTLQSFRNLVPDTFLVKSWGLWSSILKLPYRLVEGRPINADSRTGIKRLLVKVLNPGVVTAGQLLNRRAFKLLMKIDPFLSNRLLTYRQLAFLIVKEPNNLITPEPPPIEIDRMLDFKVPLHVLKAQAALSGAESRTHE